MDRGGSWNKFARFPRAVRPWAACPAAHVTRRNEFVAPVLTSCRKLAASCFVYA